MSFSFSFSFLESRDFRREAKEALKSNDYMTQSHKAGFI